MADSSPTVKQCVAPVTRPSASQLSEGTGNIQGQFESLRMLVPLVVIDFGLVDPRLGRVEVNMPLIATAVTRTDALWRESTRGFLSVFPTAIGWVGLLGCSRGVSRVTLGHHSPLAVREALDTDVIPGEEAHWSSKLREQLERYASGCDVDFCETLIVRPRPLTVFQQRVVDAVRAIPRGETMTYGEVAALVGSPRAARAVGTVMSTNPVPIIVPCHRVVGSAGGLGGFSAAGGVRTKQWMLDLESTQTT